MGIMYQDHLRSFELLKLVRDKRITNVMEFVDSIPSRMPSELYMFADRWVKGLQELGLIDVNENGEIITTDRLTVLIDALGIRLTQLTDYSMFDSVVCSPLFGVFSKPSVKSDIFVVMPFLDKLKPIYDDHIKNTAQKMNLTVARGDDFFTAKSIISDIWDAINSCRLVIADCTGRNPNVFYEIGMAHTLGKPVILISQNKDDIPFDIQHIRYLIYEFTPRGMSEFENRLASTIESELRFENTYEMILDSRK
jgi:nucleoside 2-deoxyribosyltransferase